MNTEYLEQECWIDTYFHENSQEKKYNLAEKPFSKDNFNYENEIKTYICSLGQPLCHVRE